jgi:hypothetical protein
MRISRRTFLFGIGALTLVTPASGAASGFMVGVNYPWIGYGHDFGENAWGYDGLTTKYSQIQQDFRTIAGILGKCLTRVIRVFVLCDGRASPEFSRTGAVVGFDGSFFPDFDTLLTVASQQNLLVVPVLLDFFWCHLPRMAGAVQLGGHADVIRDPLKRQTFLDNALAPLVRRYASSSRILAWEIINEPERAMQGLASGPASDLVTIAEMQEFVQACAATIHGLTSQKVTVGSSRRRWVSYWQGLGLDLYQFRWYDGDASEEAFPWASAVSLGLDRPCFVGEVSTASTQYSTKDYLEAAAAGGYQGLFVWSYRAQDDFSNFSASSLRLTRWCGRPGK